MEFRTWIGLALTAVAALPAAAQEAPAPADPATFDAAAARYRAMRERPSLNRRLEGRMILARIADERAFATLVEDYRAPDQPEEVVRSVLVTQLADFHPEPRPAAWRAWRTEHGKAEHSWLWFRALCIEDAAEPGVWREAAGSGLPVELRAAALAAAAARKGGAVLDDETLGFVMELAAKLPSRPHERAMLLEGLFGLFETPSAALQPRQRGVLRSLVHIMGERQTSPRSRIVLARSLARALGRDNIGTNAADWLELLADAPADQIELAYAKKRAVAKHGFFGITEFGKAIAYVIDASDSMLEPLTPRELADLQPRTGVGAPAGGTSTGASAERALDWTKVKTRFDGARELLKLALRDLAPDTRFCVVLFGDKAEYLASTPELVPASPKNVAAACAAIDAIATGPVRQDRPHGTLRGKTNLHGGMALAFRAGEGKRTRGAAKRRIPQYAQLDERGVDTIYLLSDGAPSSDDWDGRDTSDHDYVMDGETRERRPHQGDVIYGGPFTWVSYLVPELRRLNLLQRSAIHAIGIGEADFRLLELIAAAGHGSTVVIGKQ